MRAFEPFGPSWMVALALAELLTLVFTSVWGRFPSIEASVLY
jgi:hypothetical protein